MGNLLVYSGIVTKIRAMEARLLKPEQFEEIASLHSVPEVCTYLKENSAYADILKELDEEHLHRGDIEKVLIRSLYRDYSKIYRFSTIEQRKFLKLYLKRYEIDLINYCFRIVINHYTEPFDLSYKQSFFDRYSQISIEKLITSRTTDELVENLKGTEYYEPLHKPVSYTHLYHAIQSCLAEKGSGLCKPALFCCLILPHMGIGNYSKADISSSVNGPRRITLR